jgi:cell division septation protein DedD
MNNNDKDSGEGTPQGQRREPVFSGFEDEDAYEEPDRDTDYASSYHEESLEDEEFDESSQDEDDFTPQTEIEWEDPQPDNSWEEPDPAPDVEPEQNEEEEEQEDDEWDNEQGYYEEDSGGFQKWPLGLIVVAIVALVLMAAGGYGVIQQRSATQEEIRQLQATLATTASPAAVSASRDAQREVQERNTELLAAVDALTLENRRLTDTVTGLESQLAAQQIALAKPKPAAVVTPAPVKPTPQPATPKSAAPVIAGGGAWFVNFSSYDRRTTAEDWVSKLKPEAGKVVVTTGNKEGATVYRVRVIELANRESAEKIARQLEREHGLPKLWVGHK